MITSFISHSLFCKRGWKEGSISLRPTVVTGDRQAPAAFAITHVDLVVPVAMLAVAKTLTQQGGIYIAEFEAVRRAELPLFSKLGTATEAFYELVPPVKGT